MNVQLPVIYCPECTSQLATHVCVIVGTDILICALCARRRALGGQGRTVAPVYPSTGWRGMGYADALDPVDAIALLARHGAAITDGLPS